MAKKKLDLDADTIRVMRQVLAMPPKPHEEMKIGRPAQNKKRGSKGRASSAKRRTA
jgi:hypothetical protein